MNIWWCRGCGREETRGAGACPTCGSALQESGVPWLEPNAEGEETVFELDPEPLERAAIVDALVHEKIAHRWDNDNELVVADPHADTVDEILDEVLGVETRADGDGSSGGVPQTVVQSSDDFDPYRDDDEGDDDGSESYSTLSKLYVAVDKLQGNRDDDDIIRFASVTGEILMAPPPFGVDDETWADIQSAARNAASALEMDSSAPVDADLKALRNQLHELV